MISSRWRPAQSGTMHRSTSVGLHRLRSTDWRAITPGATFSITSVIFALIGPLPSIGWPQRVDHPADQLGPTGTSSDAARAFDGIAFGMCSYSPRITAPTESR